MTNIMRYHFIFVATFSFGVSNLYQLAPALFPALAVIVTMLVGMLASAISRKMIVIKIISIK